jgi:Fe2+ or Zn2+ uptake regulation protein
VTPHYHFIRELCGDIYDLDLTVKSELMRKIAPPKGFEVRRHEIELYGLCAKCSSRS